MVNLQSIKRNVKLNHYQHANLRTVNVVCVCMFFVPYAEPNCTDCTTFGMWHRHTPAPSASSEHATANGWRALPRNSELSGGRHNGSSAVGRSLISTIALLFYLSPNRTP